MKLLHLADLHIGKLLHKHSLLEDQALILKQILDIAEQEKPDAVLIAGDLYQRSNPSPEAMTLCSSFLTSISELGLPCYLISGNHDSAERIQYLSSFAERCGIHIAGGKPGEITEFLQDDEYGTVHFHLLPYLTPLFMQQNSAEDQKTVCTYEEAVRTAISSHPPLPAADRHVMICHQFLTGAACCDSEELAVGGMDNIPVSLFDDYDYAALGHLHGPQYVGRETVRYAGSPLKYSFSEINQKKSVTIAELKEKGHVQIRLIPLQAPREMRIVSGLFEELMQQPVCGDYVQIQLNDTLPPPDAARMLRSVYPNLLLLTVQNGKQQEDSFVEAVTLPEQSDFKLLLKEFYASQNNGKTITEAQESLIRQLTLRMEQEVNTE